MIAVIFGYKVDFLASKHKFACKFIAGTEGTVSNIVDNAFEFWRFGGRSVDEVVVRYFFSRGLCVSEY
mgnify:FL=1